MDVLVQKLESIWNYLFHKGGIIISTLLTLFLDVIGYPKQVINFVVTLIIIDILTRWMAEVVKVYGLFTFKNFLKAWKNKVLNSKKLKKGLFVKIIFYSIFLYIANQMYINDEIIYGKTMSNFIYSIMITLDCISIGENSVDAGISSFKILVQFFKNKERQLLNKDKKDKKE